MDKSQGAHRVKENGTFGNHCDTASYAQTDITSADGITVSILCKREEAARGSLDRRPSSNFNFNSTDISFTKRTLSLYEDGTGGR